MILILLKEINFQKVGLASKMDTFKWALSLSLLFWNSQWKNEMRVKTADLVLHALMTQTAIYLSLFSDWVNDMHFR